jgi:ATP-dependent protease ClpP protease subunit
MTEVTPNLLCGHADAVTEKILERDYFMPAEGALEMGLIDEVLTTRKVPSESSAESPSS